MELNEALAILERHNKWRRGDPNLKSEIPATLGTAIDVVCTEAREMSARLRLVWNFPDHPGGHPQDGSSDAESPPDWRAGWIAAVHAIQERINQDGVGT